MYRPDTAVNGDSGHVATVRRGGFTLLELLVAITISAVVILGLTKLSRDMTGTFQFEEMKSDMIQNAHYTVQRISEVLMETGACLPAKADSFTLRYDTLASLHSFTRKYNPSCAFYEFRDDLDTNVFHVDTMGEEFAKVDSVIVSWTTPDDRDTVRWKTELLAVIDNDDADPTVFDSIIVAGGNRVVRKNDIIYGYSIESWSVSSDGKLYKYTTDVSDTSMTLAENIDSLAITFNGVDTATGQSFPANTWADMRSAQVVVRTRSERPDPYKNEYITHTYMARFRLKSVVGQ